MKFIRWSCVVLLLAAGVGAAVVSWSRAQGTAAEPAAEAGMDAAPAATEQAASPSSDKEPGDEAKDERIVLPWRKIESLTKEQKQQINAIHKKALADIREIEKREHDEIFALLDGSQKMEWERLKEEAAAKRRAKAEARKAEKKTDKADDDDADDDSDDEDGEDDEDADDDEDAAPAAAREPGQPTN